MTSQKKDKLLFIMHDRPNYPGGPIINYLRLLPSLVKSNFDTHLLVFYHNDYPNARDLEKFGVKIYTKSYTYTEPMVSWILSKVEEIQPDIFIPDVSTQGCFAGKWVKEAGIPVINTHRSPDDLNTGKAIYFSDPKYYHVLTGLVSVNRYLINKLNYTIGVSPILTTVIPSGVPVPSFCAAMQSEILSVVYSGRLIEKAKRISLLIKSFIQICACNPKVSFTIIGDGPEKQNCINMVNGSPYVNRFNFTGKLIGEEYKLELVKHHAIVLLSDFEGTPGSILDGMSCGLVPVCLYFPGIEEIIEHEVNGLIVSDRENSLIKAIEVIQQNKELWQRLSLNARKTILNNFSIEITASRWINFFKDCISVSGVKRPFKAPSKINLPQKNKLLLEDNRIPKRSIVFCIKSLIALYKIVKKNNVNKYDNFISIPFNINNLDRVVVRTAILKALKKNLSLLSGKLLDSGCGKMPYKEYILSKSSVSEYIGLDIESAIQYDPKIQPDFIWDGLEMPFADDSFDCSIATEVLEHCSEPEVFLKEVNRVLKSNALFFFTVPFIWNLHEVPHDEYRFTPFSLKRHLINAGFEGIEIYATGGWHAAMAQMIGLWVMRAPISKRQSGILARLALPIMKYLLKIGKRENLDFKEGQMITGLYGIAYKKLK